MPAGPARSVTFGTESAPALPHILKVFPFDYGDTFDWARGAVMTRTVAAPGGLTAAEVARRRVAGQVNLVARRTSRDAWAIVRANVFTRFNAIIGVLLAVVLVAGPLQDGLFGLVIVVNSAVGIVQELRAKRTLDALALLERAPVQVRRDGGEVSIPPEDVVVDDLVLLASGAKVPVDGTWWRSTAWRSTSRC
jgi:magnesium-transporting ATPase (P-type)